MTWMNFDPFTSSDIEKIRYNSNSKVLEITFLKSGVYIFKQVPEAIAKEFNKAESKGKYFSRTIKSNYDYEKT